MAYLNAGLLASVPWMQISKTASQKMAVDAFWVAATAAAAVGVHVLFLAVNTAACRCAARPGCLLACSLLA